MSEDTNTADATKQVTRDVAIMLLNRQARDIRDAQRNAWKRYTEVDYELRVLVNAAERIGVTHKEAAGDLLVLLYENQKPDSDEDDRRIARAIEIIKEAYNRGKYDGREMADYFRSLFGRIGDEMLAKFDRART